MTIATPGMVLPFPSHGEDARRRRARGMGVRQPAEIEPVSIDYVTAQQANPQRTGCMRLHGSRQR